MNTRDEIVDAMNGENKDLPPPMVFTQTATTSQMRACGASWPEANSDPVSMARLSMQASRGFGFAMARVPFCLTVEAEGFGCDVDMGTADRQAMVTGSPHRSMDILDVPESPNRRCSRPPAGEEWSSTPAKRSGRRERTCSSYLRASHR